MIFLVVLVIAVILFVAPIIRNLISGCAALFGMNALRHGKSCKLSDAQISSVVINLPDAKRALPPEDFERVYQLFRSYQKSRKKDLYTPQKCVSRIAEIITSFDAVAPYTLYSGENEGITKLKLQIAYELVNGLDWSKFCDVKWEDFL